ncbi:MAG: alkaline phosphatase [Deltaproteobacteria bacterium]|nr:alkaline phosphatase [Deltaproteobacteria bacterium]
MCLDANGHPCVNILEKAQAQGKGTGVVSNARVSGPGVAPYLTHSLDSEQENEIAAKIFEDPKVDVLLAGGAQNLIPQNKSTAMLTSADIARSGVITAIPDRAIDINPGVFGPILPTATPSANPNAMKLSDVSECSGIDAALDGASQRADQSNLIENTKSKGYQFVCKGDQLSAIASAADTKLLGIFSASTFPRSPDRKSLSALPSLADLTSKAIEVLDKKPNGFLLVVQGGMTSQVAQENDPGTLLQEGLDFDAAITAALAYADAHSDTLVIVTSDHETGGFGFAYSKGKGNDLTLPSGDEYNAPYDYAPTIRYDALIDQRKSFYLMTKEVVDKLYAQGSTVNLNEAGQMLVDDVQTNTTLKLNLNQAKTILDRAPGSDNATTQDFSQFYVGENVHANLLGRATATQTSAVWASGTPTSTPVMILATGPSAYADRVRGFIDNTDVGKIINAALAGK